MRIRAACVKRSRERQTVAAMTVRASCCMPRQRGTAQVTSAFAARLDDEHFDDRLIQREAQEDTGMVTRDELVPPRASLPAYAWRGDFNQTGEEFSRPVSGGAGLNRAAPNRNPCARRTLRPLH